MTNTKLKKINRIDRIFEKRRDEKCAAMIYYVTAGYPDSAATLESVDALVEGGIDLLELGVPFSDPIADGPTIQQASYIALENGIKIPTILELAGKIRKRHPDLAMLLFTAYNPIFHMGEAEFVNAAREAGADGLLVPDLPPEEGSGLQKLCAESNLALVYLVAPTTTPERAGMIAEATTGFVYCISLKGVTGARAEIPPELESQIRQLRTITDKPLAVGFGISRPEQVNAIARFADGIVIGSQLIKLVGQDKNDPERKQRISDYARSMREAIR